MNPCMRCGSHAINHGHHGRNGSDPDLCDVCYWRSRAEYSEDFSAERIRKAKEEMREECARVAVKKKFVSYALRWGTYEQGVNDAGSEIANEIRNIEVK